MDALAGDARRARRELVVVTGAGISAESGLATFRAADGLWNDHRVEDVASPDGFARDPDLVNAFYDTRRRDAASAQPNAAHLALAELENRLGDRMLIVTQNVDDLHERAGSRNVIHVHGELESALCAACGARHRWAGDLADRPPCPACGERTLRPDVVWFGEIVYRWDEIERAVEQCSALVVIGTSGSVAPVSGLALLARALGAETVLINLDDPEEPWWFDRILLGRASELVPAWVSSVLDRPEAEAHTGSEDR